MEEELASKYVEEYFDKINEKIGNNDGEDGGMIQGSLWNIKKGSFSEK